MEQIDAYEAARTANGPRDSRHRIEHFELIHPQDLQRLGALGIVGSLQPAHVPGAMVEPLQPTAGCIPRDRWADAFRCASLNVPLAFGSEWPVADVSVLRAVKAALTRQPVVTRHRNHSGMLEVQLRRCCATFRVARPPASFIPTGSVTQIG